MAVISSNRYRRSSRAAILACLDSLETRTLLSALVIHSTNGLSPATLASDGNGGVYAADFGSGIDKGTLNGDGSLNLTNLGNATANYSLTGVAYSASDNTLWGVAFGNELVHFDTSGNQIGPVFTPNAGTQFVNNGDFFTSLTVDSHGIVWLTSTGTGTVSGDANTRNDDNQVSEIGRFDLGTGQFSFASLATGSGPQFLAAAPDGTVWTTVQNVFQNNTAHTFSFSSSVDQVSWDGSSVHVASFNVADSANQLSNPVVVPSTGGSGNYSIWYASNVVNFTNLGSTSYPDVGGQLDQLTVTGGVPQTTTVNLPGGGTQTQLATTTHALPTGPHNALIANDIAVDSSGVLWIPGVDQQDIIDNFNNTPGAQPVVNALDSFDTTTGDYSRIILGDGQPLAAAASGSTVWVISSPFSGDPLQLDTVDTASSTGDIAAVAGFSAVANQPYTGTLADFASSNSGAFTYSIDYGNGTTGTGTVANDGSTNMFSIPANVTYAAAGNYNLTLTIVSANGDIATVHGSAIVTGSTPLLVQGVPTISGQKDIALTPNVVGQSTLVVAQFSGAPASYTATINWGDGTPTINGTIVSLGSNQYAVKLAAGQTKTYGALGSFTISVSISDGSQTLVATSTATIVAVPVVASQHLVLQPLIGPIFLGTVATFTADPLATASWFKATIHWGDGTTSAGLIVRTSAGTFQVIGLHIYKKGTFSVTTNIVDSVDAETALATATIKIAK